MRPRQIIPRRTYLITRRTTHGTFLLRPSAEVRTCILYCLALAQRRAKVRIHAVIFLSNHYHIVVTDDAGLLPDFTEELNKNITKALNVHHDRSENIWAANVQTNHLELVRPEDVLNKTVYALANPVAAGLVSEGRKWPGVRLVGNKRFLVKKPNFFFRREEDGGLPDELYLHITPPPVDEDPDKALALVESAVVEKERALRETARLEGRRFLGAAAIRAQSIYATPKEPLPKGAIVPEIGCQDPELRQEALAERRAFVAEHEASRKSWRAGFIDVLFPPGTYRFVQQFGARCAEALRPPLTCAET